MISAKAYSFLFFSCCLVYLIVDVSGPALSIDVGCKVMWTS